MNAQLRWWTYRCVPVGAALLFGCSPKPSGPETPVGFEQILLTGTGKPVVLKKVDQEHWSYTDRLFTGYEETGEEKIKLEDRSPNIVNARELEVVYRDDLGFNVVDQDTKKIIFGSGVAGSFRGFQVEIPGAEEDAKTILSLMKRLDDGCRQGALARMGMPPFGHTSSLYHGHVFWDMDVWMLPAMILLNPSHARAMTNYRIERAPMAGKNAAAYFNDAPDRPGERPMMFPWESSVTGKETVPGPSKKQHHISGSVVWGLTQAELAGIETPDRVAPVVRGVREFFRRRSVKTARGLEIQDVMSPDEFHIGDNDLYTNLLAEWVTAGRTWRSAPRYFLPRDKETFLTYDGDALRSYKQAAAVLAIYPLRYPPAVAEARKMMERFEGKITKNGPAMTESVHSTIWSMIGEPEKAYASWQKATTPYLRPGRMFAEKPKGDRVYFYTGAAGALNSIFYGFLGLEFTRAPRGPVIHTLKNGVKLTARARLPRAWPSLKISGISIDGRACAISARQGSEQVTLTFMEPSR